MFGVAVRTKKPLALPLSSLVWKLIVQEPVTWDDLEENDTLYAQSLRGVQDIHLSGVTEANFHEVIDLLSFFFTLTGVRTTLVIYSSNIIFRYELIKIHICILIRFSYLLHKLYNIETMVNSCGIIFK